MAQPLADLSNLGAPAPAAADAPSSLKGNIVGNNAAADDAPGASTQAALDRLLGGSSGGDHQRSLDAAVGHSGWQPRGRAVAAAKAAVAVAAKATANASSTMRTLNSTSNARGHAPYVAHAAPDAGVEADDDASPPSSEGRSDAGATPPMRTGGAAAAGAGEGRAEKNDELENSNNGRDDEDNDDDDDGHESGSSGPCQLPPLAARSAIVKRRQAAAANRVSERVERREKKMARFFFFGYKTSCPFFLFFSHLDLDLNLLLFKTLSLNPGGENADARGVQRRRTGRRQQ